MTPLTHAMGLRLLCKAVSGRSGFSHLGQTRSCPRTIYAVHTKHTRPQWFYGQIPPNVAILCFQKLKRGSTAQLVLSTSSTMTTNADRRRNRGPALHVTIDEKSEESRVMTKLGLSQECTVLFRVTIYSCISPHSQIQGEKPYDRLNTGVQGA